MEIRNRDRALNGASFLALPRYPVTVVLDNIRSAYNVGSIFRTADCARISMLCLCGITPFPPHEKVEKTALGATDFVPWTYYADTLQAIGELKKSGIFVASFETAEGSENYFDFSWPRPLAIVLGNEKEGLSPEVLSLSDAVLEVPAWGMKNSINVANLFGIAVYEVIRKYGDSVPFFREPLGGFGGTV